MHYAIFIGCGTPLANIGTLFTCRRGNELEQQLAAGADDREREASDAAEGANDDARLAAAVVDSDVVVRARLVVADHSHRTHDVVVAPLAVHAELAAFREQLQSKNVVVSHRHRFLNFYLLIQFPTE